VKARSGVLARVGRFLPATVWVHEIKHDGYRFIRAKAKRPQRLDDRSGRQPFWIGVLVLAVVETICQAVSHRIEGDRLGSIVDLAFSYPEFAPTLKRAHDRNMSTWWIAALFVGSVLLDFLAVTGVNTELGDMNKPNLIGVILTIPMGILSLVLLIDLGFRPGTKGPNRFCPDPLGN
jgi:uncharacterized membrane protein YhaH (DUF805 family)